MDRYRNVSNTSLTEFAPLSPETNEPGVGYQLLSKFFSFNKDESPPLGTNSSSGSPQSSTPIHTETMSSRRGSNESIQSTVSTGSAFPVNISEGRSLPNVLKRISNLLALKSNSLQAYKDTHLKQYWMPDSVSRECYDCEERFTTFRRRHHCRVCGQIFCSRCCNQEIPGKIMGCTGDLRVCTYCCKVVLGYLQSADMDAQLTADLRALQEDLQTKLGGGAGATPTPPLPVGGGTSGEAGPARRKLSAGFQEDNFALGRVPSDGLLRLEEEDGMRRPGSLRTLYQDLRRAGSGLPAQAHRYRLRTQRNCFLGSQLVDWLLAQARAANREQACAIGQALIDAGYLSPVGDQVFVDGFALYRPRDPPTARTLAGADDDLGGIAGQDEPRTERRHPSTSSFDLDLDVGANTAHLSRAAAPTTPSTPSTPGTPQDLEGQVGILDTNGLPNPERPVDPGRPADQERPANTSWHSATNLRTDNGELQAYQSLKEAFAAHEAALCRQSLNAEGLSQGWLDVVLPICHRLVDLVRPDVTNEPAEMDIRKYVQLKKVCGGTRSDSCVLSGAACTKNVAHRAMPARLRNPRILLLGCAIVYQRVEGRLTAIDRVVMQEREYLGHVAQRIAAVAPDVVLVERGVSRLAQDSLLAQGIALAVQVKPAALARIARLTGADIASSVDAHLSRIRLGTCRTFYTRAFPAHAGEGRKTLMFFEDCPAPERGCTVLLRGGTRSELARVKRVARLMLFARYNWRLEHSFLMDEFARPPTPPRGVFTDDNIQRVVGREDRTAVTHEKSQSPTAQSPQSPGSRDSPSLYASAAGAGFVLVDDIDDSSHSDFNVEETVLKGIPVAVEKAKEAAKVETVSDRSDPLHSEGAEEPEGDVMAVSEPQAANRFRKALDDTILSVSPFLKWSEPFLETEAGRRCALRRFFPTQVFRSAQLEDRPAPTRVEPAAPAGQDFDAVATKLAAAKLGPQHELVWTKLTSRADAESVQTTLADFRARGGRVLASTNQWAAPEPSEGNRSRVSSAPSQGADTAVSAEADVDALDPARHQTLAVLFSSHSLHSANAPAFCVSPWVVKMEFYGRNDIPLGGFLERYCFRESYACPSDTCDAPMLAHVRRFVHGSGCVHVSLRRLDRPLDADPQQILVWSWCSRCRQSSSQPLSAESWALSLAKYLELRFHGGAYKLRGTAALTCTHSLHHEHYQYFGFNDLIASFKYATVTPWDVSLPPPLIEIRYLAEQRASLVEDIKKLSMAGHDVYSAVLETLCALGTQLEGVAALKQLHKTEHAALKACIEEVQLRLVAPSLRALPKDGSPMDKEAVTSLWALEDSVTHLKAHVALAVTRWNARIQDAVGARRKDKSPAQAARLTETGSESGLDADPGVNRPVVADEALLVSSAPPYGSNSPASNGSSPCGETAPVWEDAPDPPAQPCPAELPSPKEETVLETGAPEEPVATKKLVKANELDVVHPLETQELVSTLEPVDVSELAAPRESFATQEPVADQDAVSIREPVTVREHTVGTETLPLGCDGETEGKQSPAPPDRKSVKTIIMSQLRPAAPAFTPLQSPLPAAEHHLPTAGSLAPTPVLDNEPSSLIAHALASHEYRRALAELGATKAASTTASPLSKRRSGPSPSGEKIDSASELTQSAESRKSAVLSFLRGSASAGSSPARSGTDEEPTSPPMPSQPTAAAAVETEPQGEIRETRTRPGPGLHVEVALGGSGGVSLSCRVYFAEAFASLRRLVLPQGEEAFVRSLARCVTWAARGGRSGSAFCKTRDDRFVLKEMPRAELQVFLEFAPHYFGHVMRCHATSTPTLLGKIVGVFRVGLRNTATGTSSKATLLVMENLFYARAVTHKFDLKGSVRNRLVDPAEHGLGDVVLLDENLIKMACDSPLYMAAHSESVLSRAIDNDTRFLAAQDVMDYSLLVGLDSERRQLVVGIIDYIRTFTWDKRLETMVKSSGILGGQGKMPTVVSPELYRARFIASMHQYFLPVPDRWAGLGKDIDWARDEGKT